MLQVTPEAGTLENAVSRFDDDDEEDLLPSTRPDRRSRDSISRSDAEELFERNKARLARWLDQRDARTRERKEYEQAREKGEQEMLSAIQDLYSRDKADSDELKAARAEILVQLKALQDERIKLVSRLEGSRWVFIGIGAVVAFLVPVITLVLTLIWHH